MGTNGSPGNLRTRSSTSLPYPGAPLEVCCGSRLLEEGHSQNFAECWLLWEKDRWPKWFGWNSSFNTSKESFLKGKEIQIRQGYSMSTGPWGTSSPCWFAPSTSWILRGRWKMVRLHLCPRRLVGLESWLDLLFFLLAFNQSGDWKFHVICCFFVYKKKVGKLQTSWFLGIGIMMDLPFFLVEKLTDFWHR